MKIYDESGKPLFLYCFGDGECGYYYYTDRELNLVEVEEVVRHIHDNSTKREILRVTDECPWDEPEEKIEEWIQLKGGPPRIDFNQTILEKFGLHPLWEVPTFAKPFDL